MSSRLPLFPLPMVLYPGVPLPLHVFEPRYRQMMAHCLEGDRRFGLIYHDPDRAGPYLVEPGQVGCVAEIQKFQPLPDGRSLVLTQGTERFRVTGEPEQDAGAMYYEALVEPYADLPEDEESVRRHCEATRELYRRAFEENIENLESLPPIDPEATLSFQIAQWIKIDPAWQQQFLESRSEEERLDRLDELLRGALE